MPDAIAAVPMSLRTVQEIYDCISKPLKLGPRPHFSSDCLEGWIEDKTGPGGVDILTFHNRENAMQPLLNIITYNCTWEVHSVDRSLINRDNTSKIVKCSM